MTETITPINDLIKAVEKADSSSSLFLAVSNLAKVRSPLAIPTLIEVLAFNNPGAAVAATEGLIALGETAITSLLENVDDYNYGARAWAIRVFAGIGDPRGLDLLLKAASSDFSLSVRRAATKGGPRKYHMGQNDLRKPIPSPTKSIRYPPHYGPRW